MNSYKKQDASSQQPTNPNMIEACADKADVELRCIMEVQAGDGGSYSGPLTGAVEFDALVFPTKSEMEEMERQRRLLREQQQQDVEAGVSLPLPEVLEQMGEGDTGATEGAAGAAGAAGATAAGSLSAAGAAHKSKRGSILAFLTSRYVA